MLTISPFSNTALPPVPTGPFFDTWANVAGLYRDAMQTNAQQLLQSSASIIQEHTLRALISASKACSEALAKNALSVQEQSLGRLFEANQKAAGVMNRAFMQAWLGGMQPVV